MSKCNGWGSYEGPCGAYDCASCHPEYQWSCPDCGWKGYVDWDDDEIRACPSCGYIEPGTELIVYEGEAMDVIPEDERDVP